MTKVKNKNRKRPVQSVRSAPVRMLIQMKETALSLLYPDTCPFCGTLSDGGVCDTCRNGREYIPIGEPRCMRCGKPLRDERQEFCADCEKGTHFFDRGYALWEHSGGVKRSIYQFKFHNTRIYSRFFAEELLAQYETVIRRWGISVIIPIPLSRKKQKKRGYNQAELIADQIGRTMEIPVCKDALIRVRNTRPQKELGMRQRRRNMHGAFRWAAGALNGQKVLLIDDIYTTGNTIDSAAFALRRAGASKVYFLTISIGQGR